MYEDIDDGEKPQTTNMYSRRYERRRILRHLLPVGHHIPLPFILNRARMELAGPPIAADDIPLVDSPEEALRALAGICAGRYNPYVPATGDLGRLLAIAAGLGDPAVEACPLRTPSRPDPVQGEDRHDPGLLTPPFGYSRFRHDEGGLREQVACYGLNSVIRPLYFRWALWRLRRLIDTPRPGHRTPHTPRWL